MAEFASVVDAVRCAVEIQEELKDRNKELPENRNGWSFGLGSILGMWSRKAIHILGDGVNIAARVEEFGRSGRDLYFRNGL